MFSPSYTFIFVFINMLILFFVLRHLLFKPVTKLMQDRTNSIKESLDGAEKTKADAFDLKQKYENQLNTAKDEADKIINEARARANREYDSIINAAKQDAEGIKAKAKEEIERERIQMMNGVKNQVASLALLAAGKVIEANMDTAGNRALVEKFIDEAGAA